MTTSRRTILAVLGLAPAAIGSEAFANPPDMPGEIQSVSTAFSNERAAKALEALARELRRGSIDTTSINVSSDMTANDIADQHTLTFRFLHKPEV